SIVKEKKLVNISVGQDLKEKFPYDPRNWVKDQNLIINFSENNILQDLLNKINKADERLSDFLDISNGCKPYQAGYGKNLNGLPLIKEDVINRIYHSNTKQSEEFYLELKGKHVQRFYTKDSTDYIK